MVSVCFSVKSCLAKRKNEKEGKKEEGIKTLKIESYLLDLSRSCAKSDKCSQQEPIFLWKIVVCCSFFDVDYLKKK